MTATQTIEYRFSGGITGKITQADQDDIEALRAMAAKNGQTVEITDSFALLPTWTEQDAPEAPVELVGPAVQLSLEAVAIVAAERSAHGLQPSMFGEVTG